MRKIKSCKKSPFKKTVSARATDAMRARINACVETRRAKKRKCYTNDIVVECLEGYLHVIENEYDSEPVVRSQIEAVVGDPLVNLKGAKIRIGVSAPYLRAVLKAMHRCGQTYLDTATIEEIKKWIVDHPKFRMKTRSPLDTSE